MPSLATGNSIAFLDPHERYFRKYGGRTGIKFDMDKNDRAYFEQYPDQFRPFMNKIGGQLNLKDTFDGTLFRFPIRNKEAAETSELCGHYADFHQLIDRDVLEPFFQDFHLILLFLRNIESIELYKLNGDCEQLIASTYIDLSNSDADLLRKRSEYNAYLKRTVNVDKTMNPKLFELEDFTSNWKFTISTKELSNGIWSERSDTYLLSSFIGLNSMSDELRNTAFAISTIPICNVAFKYNARDDEAFRVHCFLPLPETLTTGLKIFVNGAFSLTENRRDLKWPDHDTRNDLTYVWNEYFSSEVLSKAIRQLLIYAKSFVHADLTVKGFYQMFPIPSEMNERFRKCLSHLLRSLHEMELVVTVTNEWSTTANVLFANEFIDHIQNSKQDNKRVLIDILYRLFDNRIAAPSLPDHVRQFYAEWNEENGSKPLDLKLFASKLGASGMSLTNEEKVVLVNYLMANIESCDLNGLDLLPLLDGSWEIFSQSSNDSVVIFENSADLAMFAECKILEKWIFNLGLLSVDSTDRLIGYLRKHKTFNQVKLFDKDVFLVFLNELHHELDVARHERVWQYIYRNYNNSLADLVAFKIISIDTNNNQYSSLKENSLKYFFYHKKNLNSEITDFVTKHGFDPTTSTGCVLLDFDKLPYGLANHPRLADYFDELKPANLVACFELIETYTGCDFRVLAQDQMTMPCKQVIYDLVCSKAISASCHKEFFKTKLPVFELFDPYFNSIKKFEQHEDLFKRLRKLLDGYTKFTIFNEMIQNADDAQATRVEFCFDSRQFGQWKSKQSMKSLWVYNNSVFAEDDFENLELLGSENKMEKADKIGKFGVGFNSVYNFTDCPSILSQDSLVILNPTKECLKSSTGIRIKYAESRLATNSLLNECLRAHDGLFGFDTVECKRAASFNGTIIRLPLRVDESLLSANVFDDDAEIMELIRQFYHISHDILLFTQNVSEIRVSTVKGKLAS